MKGRHGRLLHLRRCKCGLGSAEIQFDSQNPRYAPAVRKVAKKATRKRPGGKAGASDQSSARSGSKARAKPKRKSGAKQKSGTRSKSKRKNS